MLPSSAAYKLALPQSHKREFTFTARTLEGEILAQDVPIGGAQVVASVTSRVSRTANFQVSNEWFPVAASDPLSPYHAIVEIRAGISYPTGERETFPVFTGRVYDADRATNGQVTVRADDLAAEVLAADFETPVNSVPGRSTVAEMERLILAGFPYATFGTHDVIDSVVPQLSWDDDAGKALDDLAAVVGGRWFTLGNGDFVIRRNAYTDLTPVIELTDGPNGTLSSARTRVTADGSWNMVIVEAERADGGDPIRAVARNDNVLDPAHYAGPFGKRVRKIRLQTATTIADAQRAAATELAAGAALSRQWNVTAVPDMTLEPGDVIGLRWRGVQDVQVIDSLTYSLSPQESMPIGTRSAVVAAVSI